MPHIHQDIREKHILGRLTRVHVVRASDEDERDWLRKAPVCQELLRHSISHCGIMHASHPMEIVRLQLSGTFFMACLEGEGEVLIDGQWKRMGRGLACVQPPFIANALRARKRKSWSFCWVRYEEMPEKEPIVAINSPAVGEFEAAPLRSALEGLHAEVRAGASAVALRSWVELINGYVHSFAHVFRGKDRLHTVWKAVERNLARPWSLADLAELAEVSKEHLRRLTTRSLGRTPIQQVTYLRMRRAANLLATTQLTVAQVASRVGFATPYAFSDTFLRLTGCRPSVYRDQFDRDKA